MMKTIFPKKIYSKKRINFAKFKEKPEQVLLALWQNTKQGGLSLVFNPIKNTPTIDQAKYELITKNNNINFFEGKIINVDFSDISALYVTSYNDFAGNCIMQHVYNQLHQSSFKMI